MTGLRKRRPALLNGFHTSDVLHVTFGSALAQFGVELKTALVQYGNAYHKDLQTHLNKYLSLLK